MKEQCYHLGVKGLICDDAGKILLLKINSAGLVNFKGEPYWDLPGGRVQEGESIASTLAREIEEETGYTINPQSELFLMTISNIRIPLSTGGEVGLILAAYLCRVNNGKLRLSDEHLEARWFEPLEASQLLQVKYAPEFTSRVATL